MVVNALTHSLTHTLTPIAHSAVGLFFSCMTVSSHVASCWLHWRSLQCSKISEKWRTRRKTPVAIRRTGNSSAGPPFRAEIAHSLRRTTVLTLLLVRFWNGMSGAQPQALCRDTRLTHYNHIRNTGQHLWHRIGDTGICLRPLNV